ncbi:DUF547 domain-containing protein [Flagellimonas allohymeniacidonis]|uniref:DUF547 domain-containing protein n=1 Tax=Flagellimonas allohymeniacidonis TaxID=2517819 RepID=A0A4Q8QCG3_9FLAO|nr:DUF547 domain-containing protein [Allomuricauda hymeniacidonis]TAI48021.1 DUF547 domain-containing protein [Allomuricauda hymeniacidonis]
MKSPLNYLLIFTVLISCRGATQTSLTPNHKQSFHAERIPQSEIQTLDHSVWGDLLKKYVDDEGNVNYGGLKENVQSLQAYLDFLAENPPAKDWGKNEKLAYYINLYNAATVKLIVDHYPIISIKDIPNRWKRDWIKVGSKLTSLNDIEHKILRKMDEPRIHFAINCASYSCPKLLNSAFTAQSMERLLSKTAVDFINDTKRNRFQKGKAELSRIFKWYKGDFTERKSLLEYINTYLNNPVAKDADIDYLEYDWSLNEAK